MLARLRGALAAALAVAPVLLLVALWATSAPAAEAPTVVTVPVGDWLAQGVTWLGSVALAVASWVVARWVPLWARQYLTDRVLANAIDYALASVAGAARGRTLTLPIANAVLAEAVSYAVENAPALADQLGDTLRQKLIARLGAAGAIPADLSARDLAG